MEGGEVWILGGEVKMDGLRGVFIFGAGGG